MVDITLEYSRPFRALKLWLAFRAHGAEAFRDAVENNLRQARLLYELVLEHDALEPLCGPPPLSIVPFRHRRLRRRSERRTTPSSCARSRTTAASGWRRRRSTARSACGRASSTSARPTTTCARSSTSPSSSGAAEANHGAVPSSDDGGAPSDEPDLTSRRGMRALLDAIPDLMFRITADGTYVDFVGDAELLANPWEEVVGGKMDELLPPDVARPLMATIRRRARDGRAADAQLRAADDPRRRAPVRGEGRADRRQPGRHDRARRDRAQADRARAACRPRPPRPGA